MIVHLYKPKFKTHCGKKIKRFNSDQAFDLDYVLSPSILTTYYKDNSCLVCYEAALLKMLSVL